MFKVEVLVRDVSEGRAKEYHENYFKDPVYQVVTFYSNIFYPGHMKKMPEVLYHVGIRIYGGVDSDVIYEYTTGGIEAKSVTADLNREGYMLLEHGSYEKSEEEVKTFIEWMTSPTIQDQYNKSMYDIPLNNCIHFFKDACVILGMEFPPEFQELLTWLGKHPTMVRIGGGDIAGSISKASGSGAN